MKDFLNKARSFGENAVAKATEAGSKLAEKAATIDLSGVKETVTGGFKTVVDGAGNIVDAAGNRITHPADAFDEGVAAALSAMGEFCSLDQLNIENPYK